MKGFRLAMTMLAGVLLFFMQDRSAHAFWGWHKAAKPAKSRPAPFSKEKKFAGVRVFEQEQSMVLFSIYPVKTESSGKPTRAEKNLREIGYKLVDRSSEPGQLFAATGWVEIRFQDKEGFNLMTAPVRFENAKTEYYGFVRIDPSKARQIARVEVRPLKPSEIPAPAAEPVAPPKPASTAAPKPAAEPEHLFTAEQTAQIAAESQKRAALKKSAPQAIVTNEVLQKTLQDLEKKETVPPKEKPV